MLIELIGNLSRDCELKTRKQLGNDHVITSGVLSFLLPFIRASFLPISGRELEDPPQHDRDGGRGHRHEVQVGLRAGSTR